MDFPDVDEAARRPLTYWNVDGLPELVMGGLWLLWAAMLAVMELAPTHRWLLPLALALPILVSVLTVLSHRIVKRLKARLTFPRTGYVAWPKPGPRARILPALLAAAVAGGVAMLAVNGRTLPLRDLLPPGMGLVLAAAFLAASVRQKMPHYLWLSATALIVGLGLGRQHMELNASIGWLLLALGLLSTLLGALRLRHYLRSNPLPDGAAE